MSQHVKQVKAVYAAGYTDYEGLATWRAMPTRNVPIEAMDPFLFLNHHGPQDYKPGNNGLPFGPHPHKGFETVTFIITGDLVHQDSTGFNSNIREGGIQWMTAGSGIIHSETSSAEFMEKGGPVEILQLWVNLPATLKNSSPAYTGLQATDLPKISLETDRVTITPVSGNWEGKEAPIQSLSSVHLALVQVTKGANYNLAVPEGHQVLYYLIKGKVSVNSTEVETHDLVEFDQEGTKLTTMATEDALLLVGHAKPTGEPVVAHGPFVMNTQEEIRQAFVDYQQGAFGTWVH